MSDRTTKAESAEAGAPKIEITPAMIEAGREVISAQWIDFVGSSGFRLWDEVLRGVFLAMWEARLLSPGESQRIPTDEVHFHRS